MISESKLKKILNEKAYNDIVWEYDENLIQIVKFEQKDTKVYNLVFNNLKEKHDIMIFLNEDDTDFRGFCNCPKGKEGNNCEHLIWTLIRINKDLESRLAEQNIIKTDKFKLDMLKDLAYFTSKHDEIYIELHINKLSLEEVQFELKANINNQTSYKISNIESFIKNIKDNKNLKYGKNFETQNYKINEGQLETFTILDYIMLNLQNENDTINKGIISYNLFEVLVKTFSGEYIFLKGEEYLVTNSINDVNLYVNSKGDEELELEFLKTNDYKLIGDSLAINDVSKTIHLLEEQDFRKLTLINSLESNVYSNRELRHKISLDKTETLDFKKEVLPKIYNEFDVVLDSKLNLDVVSEKLNIIISCFREGKDIIIEPKFMYGKFDANEASNEVLIRRNKHKEEIVLSFFLSKGYVYDPNEKVFVISNKRSQYLFLTEVLFELKDEYEIQMDEKLKKGIINFDSSSISINVKKNEKVDYFEVNFDIPNINPKEIEHILDAFEQKRTFYMLDDNNFLKLNDKKVYEQLLFVKEVIKDNTYKLNSYRVPEYKALQMEVEIKNKFNKYKISQKFLNYIESIKIIKPLDKEIFNKYDYKLRDYQLKGVSWLSTLYEAKLGALLADEMGLGKTLQTIAFFQAKDIKSALIVVPKSLIYNWVNEINKFAKDLEVVVIDKDKTYRENKIKEINQNQIVITSYNSLINDYSLYKNLEFNTVVIDEAQYIKNPTTKTARCVKMLKARFYIALTGTPIQNHLVDIWSIFDFILPGYYKDLNSFNKKYKTSDEINNLEILKEISAPFIMRRLKKDVLKELPDKIETDVLCSLEEEQKAIYYEYNKKVLKEIDSYINDNTYYKKNMEILAAITRLRQIAISPSLVSKDYLKKSGKIEVFEELISDIIESEEKVLVFSQYTSLLNILKESLDEMDVNYYYLDGKTPPKNRLIDIEKFNKNKVPVYLISLKAGGVGLNLTSASNVILMDPWWNPAVENQAIDRSHRIGQKNKVQVYRLISKDTIEEKIMKIKNSKEDIALQVLQNEAINLSNLETKELINLLKI